MELSMTLFTTQEKKDLKRLLARAVKQVEVMTLDSLRQMIPSDNTISP